MEVAPIQSPELVFTLQNGELASAISILLDLSIWSPCQLREPALLSYLSTYPALNPLSVVQQECIMSLAIRTLLSLKEITISFEIHNSWSTSGVTYKCCPLPTINIIMFKILFLFDIYIHVTCLYNNGILTTDFTLKSEYFTSYILSKYISSVNLMYSIQNNTWRYRRYSCRPVSLTCPWAKHFTPTSSLGAKHGTAAPSS